MSQFHCKDELKLEQHAALSPTTPSPSRGARGDPPRLTPNRIFTTHLDSIIKNKVKEKEVKSRAAKASIEVKVEEMDPESDPAHTDLHLLQERQEPYGAESEDISFGSVKEEIRIHVTTEVHLIPLPGEELSTELLDNSSKDEDGDSNIIEDQDEEPSPQLKPKSSHGKNAMEDLEANAILHRKSSKSSKKRKKSLEESTSKHRSPTREVKTHSRKSRKTKRPVQEEEPESPERNPSPTKRQSRRSNCGQRNNDVKQDKIQIKLRGTEGHHHLNRSVSLPRHETESFSTPPSLRDSSKGNLNQSWSSVSPHRDRHEERGQNSSQRKNNSPLYLYSSSECSTPAKTEDYTPKRNTLHQLRNLNSLARMSSSENYVDVAVSSASDDEIIDHEVFTVRDHPSETESMSSRSGSGCSKPSAALDFIPFCAPRPGFVPMMYQSPTGPGSPYPTSWQDPYDSTSQHYYGSPAPAMHQGVFKWHGTPDSDAIASLVRHPPPPHPLRPLFSRPPQVSPSTAEYPIKRVSFPSSDEYLIPPMNQHSLSPSLPVPMESPPGPSLPRALMPVVDRRFLCQQSLHNPPKPSIFGYQLIGDSMLVRFAQQILGEPPKISESLRFLGYCVSGQRIGDLLKRLKSDFYHLGNKIVLMIGTNDLIKNCQAEQMIHELRRVLEHLVKKAEKIVVLTLPPVPRDEHYTHHWIRLNKYNNFIRTLNNDDMGISVFDIFPKYLLSKEELEEAELLAELNSDSAFCRGCLTCMEEVEEFSDSSWSDEDDIMETDLLTSVLISTSPPSVSHIDICKLYCDKRIAKCRMDCFELKFSESSNRKDMVHLNRKGLLLVKDELYKLV